MKAKAYIVLSWWREQPDSVKVVEESSIEDKHPDEIPAKLFTSYQDAKNWADTNLNWSWRIVELSNEKMFE